ncbi:fimbrillin family protein [Phocaeicola sartorii]|uniref:fimbrillin family protein n=1 Tax=Phocaeicola sartorii TaxID=671267 RepID=UPI003513869E
MSKKIKLAGMVAMLSMTFVSCSNDELKEAYQGEKITFTTKVGASRAQVINGVADLESFRVHAEMGGDKPFLDHVKAERASSADATGIYKLTGISDNEAMWPEGVNEIEFWAYGPEQVGQPSHDGSSKILHFEKFSPQDSPAAQVDIVVAYAKSKKTSGAIPLTFHHALSQVEVKARCGDDSKHVMIKAAYIVNLKKEGELRYTSQNDTHLEWNPGSEVKYYGTSFDVITLEDKENNGKKVYQGLLAEPVDEQKGSKSGTGLMMIPQDITALNEDMDNKGVYIAMYCRIESHHSGNYENSYIGEKDPFVKDFADGGSVYHHHQLYPKTGTGYDSNAYAYTCVPITAPDGKWEPGKKYIYNLNFFDGGSGGGIVPPTDSGLPDTGNEGDKPGHPVVEEPISFTVTVEDWTEADVKDPSMN